MVFNLCCNCSPPVVPSLHTCTMSLQGEDVNYQHEIIWHMEGWRCQVNGSPDSVEIFLPWSVEGQCVNNSAVCLAGRLDQNTSVEWGSVFSSMSRDELPIWELMPEPVVMGCGWGTDHTGETTDESVEAFCTLPGGIMGLWSRKDAGYVASLTRLRQLIGSWLTQTPTHRCCRLASHLPGDRTDS